MPETQRRPSLSSYTSGNSYFYFAVFMGAVILVVGATLGGYKKNLIEEINKYDGAMTTSEKARNKDQEKELIAASKQSKIMKQLLDGKLYWSQALGYIEQMMQTSVTLTSIQADAKKGSITFKATADSYSSVARQLAAFVAATGVKDFSVNSITTTTNGTVEFSGELLIDAQAMLMKEKPSPTPRASASPVVSPTP